MPTAKRGTETELMKCCSRHPPHTLCNAGSFSGNSQQFNKWAHSIMRHAFIEGVNGKFFQHKNLRVSKRVEAKRTAAPRFNLFFGHKNKAASKRVCGSLPHARSTAAFRFRSLQFKFINFSKKHCLLII